MADNIGEAPAPLRLAGGGSWKGRGGEEPNWRSGLGGNHHGASPDPSEPMKDFCFWTRVWCQNATGAAAEPSGTLQPGGGSLLHG